MQQSAKASVGLYTLFLDRLKALQKELNKDILPFPDVRKAICPAFSINKDYCWELLYLAREFGLIEIVPFHGIRLTN
jgi:hypothetical protein